MNKLKGIIQLLIAAGLVALIVWANIKPDEGRRIEDATYVEDAQVLPENEGKRVIIAGTLQTTGYASDPDLDIAFRSTVARRVVDRLKYIDEWSWVPVSDFSTKDKLTNASFAGEATIGEFQIDPELILKLPCSERDWQEDDLDAETIARLNKSWYFVDNGVQLYLSQTSNFSDDWDYDFNKDLVGSYRLRYRLWHMDKDIDVTVVGIQRGNTLYFDEDLDASSAFEGFLSKDEMIKSDRMYALIGELLIGGIPIIVLTVLGVLNLRS